MDTWLTVCLLTLALDYGQTQSIADHPGLHEGNSVMGKHPGRGTVTAYMGGLATLYVAESKYLPKSYSQPLHAVCAVSHGSAGYSNAQLGLGWKF